MFSILESKLAAPEKPATVRRPDVIQAERRRPWRLRFVLSTCTSRCRGTLGEVLVLQGIVHSAGKTGDGQRAMKCIEYHIAGKRGLVLPAIERKGVLVRL